MKIYNLGTVFNFGKHKGKTLREIIELKNTIILNGKEFRLRDEDSYIDWCSINWDSFCMSKTTIELIKKIKPHFYLSEKAIECLNKKYEEWLEEGDDEAYNEHSSHSNNYFDNENYDLDEDHYYGSCMESPCMCSDPGW